MARTAPIPNIPAIPGMCPGIAVLGGGGGSGGSGGKGAGKGGGGVGAGGEGGAEQTGADGRGNKAGCGEGTRSGRCPANHGGGGGTASAGDPVDVSGGHVFTHPVVDLALPGPLPLRIERHYNSGSSARDVGLGFGWSHSLAWHIELRRRTLHLWRGDGTEVVFDALHDGATAMGPNGLLLARQGERLTAEGLDGVRRHFTAADDSGKRFHLEALSDVWGNRVELLREHGILAGATDSAGRSLRFQSDRAGRLTAIQVLNASQRGQWVRFASYTYDNAGDLTQVSDADGFTTHFGYQDHRLSWRRDPSGTTYHYRYDNEGRCVETWADEPADYLAPDTPDTLADGSPARGIHHAKLEYLDDGMRHVITSLCVSTYSANGFGKLDSAVVDGGVYERTYDRWGNVLSYTDPLGAVTQFKRDLRGRIIEQIDPLGRVTVTERAPDGHIERVTDPAGGITEVARSERELIWRNPAGATWHFHFDDRGQMSGAIDPIGRRSQLRYDAAGNLVERRAVDGSATAYVYDGLGRLVHERDSLGNIISYSYDGRGNLVTVHENGQQLQFRYDGDGNLAQQIDELGRVWTYRYAATRKLVAVERPNGVKLSLRYDREGWLRHIQNGAGEVYTLERAPSGKVLAETSFSGERTSYRYDATGRRIATTNGAGEVTELVYNLAGELVERVMPSGDSQRFSHNARGELIRAETPDGTFMFERDAAGAIVREAQQLDGETLSVSIAYDADGNLIQRQAEAGDGRCGTQLVLQRDERGRISRMLLDGETIGVSHNSEGFCVALDLPRGGRIERSYDPLGQLVSTAVRQSSAAQAAGEPSWLGDLEPGMTERVQFGFDAASQLVSERFAGQGAVSFERDPAGQLLARLPEQAQAELYRYDAAANPHRHATPDAQGRQPARHYGAGGQLLVDDDTRYLWDEAGRLQEEQHTRPDGTTEVTRYRWGNSGLLQAVERPDGTRVRFTYDPLARRVRKRVERERDGLRTLLSDTRYLYDGAELVHEIRRVAQAAGDPVVEERSYVYNADGTTPFAQRLAIDGAPSESGWQYIVTAGNTLPARLIDADGRVAARMDCDSWGQLQKDSEPFTPLRFAGQYFDVETGLCNNRFRYYDPHIGRYISPDPLAVRGGLELYGYALNDPTSFADADGLMPYAIVRDSSGNKVLGHDQKSGSITASQAAELSSHANPNCAETRALYDLASKNQKAGETKKDTLKRLFNDEGYTIEAWDGSKGDYENENSNSNPMNPCPKCKAMFNDLGIAGGVRAPNRKAGRKKPSSTFKRDGGGGASRRVSERWNGKTTHRDAQWKP